MRSNPCNHDFGVLTPKSYNMKGYAINEKCLQALEKTVDIQSGMLADALDIEESNVLRAVNEDENFSEFLAKSICNKDFQGLKIPFISRKYLQM